MNKDKADKLVRLIVDQRTLDEERQAATAVLAASGAWYRLDAGQARRLLARPGDCVVVRHETPFGLFGFVVQDGEYIGEISLQQSIEHKSIREDQ